MNYDPQTPFTPTYIKTAEPIREGRTLALDEQSFVRIFIQEQGPQVEKRKRYGISHNTLVNSMHLYGDKYRAELKSMRAKNHSIALMGNTAGAKEQPDVVIPREVLEPMILAGKRYCVIAKELDTTEYYVRRNAELYGIFQPETEAYRNGVLPTKMQNVSLDYLEKIEQFAPGILEAARAYYTDPLPFFHKVYEAFLQVHDIVWFLKSFAQAHRFHTETGKFPRDHISWSTNQYEMRLSQALLHHNIPHIREYLFHPRCRADFYFPGTRLLVELDGDFHDKCEATKKRDLFRSEQANLLGFIVLRFPNKVVEKDMPMVVQTIKDWLSQESKA